MEPSLEFQLRSPVLLNEVEICFNDLCVDWYTHVLQYFEILIISILWKYIFVYLSIISIIELIVTTCWLKFSWCIGPAVFKIRSETCQIKAQFCPNLYICIIYLSAGPPQVLPVSVCVPALILKTGLGKIWGPFTSFFFMKFQIQWKIHFIFTQMLTEWSLQSFAHDMTAVHCYYGMRKNLQWLVSKDLNCSKLFFSSNLNYRKKSLV